MTTLVLPPRYSDDSNTLWRTAIALGWNIERLQSWRIPASLTPQPDIQVAIYGEPIWAGFVAEQIGLQLYEPALDWLTRLPSEFVRRRVEFLTLSEVRDKEFPLFVKPAGDKTFDARVYQSADELPSPNDDLESVPVLTSEPVSWAVEYRCFVKGDQVETLSSYWRGDASTRAESGEYISPPDELEQAHEFAARVVNTQSEWRASERAVVVDVGLIEGVGWAVIEANPAFAAGIYGCDPEKVLSVVAACPFKMCTEASSS